MVCDRGSEEGSSQGGDSLRAKLDAMASERDAAQAALKELNESFAELVSERDATAANKAQLSQKAAALEAELAAAKERLAKTGAELAAAQRRPPSPRLLPSSERRSLLS